MSAPLASPKTTNRGKIRLMAGIGLGAAVLAVLFFKAHHARPAPPAPVLAEHSGAPAVSPASATARPLPPSQAPKAATLAPGMIPPVAGISLKTSSPSEKNPDFLGGEEAVASVTVAGKRYTLQPNQGGNFGRVLIGADAVASIQLVYPQAEPDDAIQIETEDGGVLDTGSVVKTGRLDGSRRINFQFKSGVQEGIYRITLRQGSDLKQLDFWVGPELPVRALIN